MNTSRPDCEAEQFSRSAQGKVEEQNMSLVERDLVDMEFVFEDGKLGAEGTMSGWSGGRIWLVTTDKAIEEWQPVAERII